MLKARAFLRLILGPKKIVRNAKMRSDNVYCHIFALVVLRRKRHDKGLSLFLVGLVVAELGRLIRVLGARQRVSHQEALGR